MKFQQAAQVFQTMKIDMLSKMIPFFDFAVVERISVDAVKYNYVAMKVDHLNGAVIFGNVVRHFSFFLRDIKSKNIIKVNITD